MSVLATVVILSGCAATIDPAGSVTSNATDAPNVAVDHALPLLQIDYSGGFAPFRTDFTSMPALTVYPDGEAIVNGPQISIYPPPTLPNLLRHDLTDADVDALVAAARDAGLLGEIPEYGRPAVADAPTTVVTLRVDGHEYVHSAEALGIADGRDLDAGETDDLATSDAAAPGQDQVGDEASSGLTTDERAARAQLAGFKAHADELVGTALPPGEAYEDGESYEIDAFAVTARPTSQDTAADDLLPWPLDVSLAEAQECVLVDGDEAQTLREALVKARWTTLYEQDGVRYDVWFRPLLPHEDECDDV